MLWQLHSMHALFSFRVYKPLVVKAIIAMAYLIAILYNKLAIALVYKSQDSIPGKKSQDLSGDRTHTHLWCDALPTELAIKPLGASWWGGRVYKC